MVKRKPRVLIADNKPAFLNELADFLKSEGYSVIAVKDIEGVKKALQTGEQYAAVIMDVRLRSDRDEKDTSGLILAKSVPRGIPTIILSRFPSPGRVRDAFATSPKGVPPAFNFITKKEADELLLPVLKDAIFVTALQKGDRRAWKHLWSEEAPSVIALCHRYGLSKDDAMRVCFEIFTSLALVPGYLLRKTTRRKSIINKAILEMRRYPSKTRPGLGKKLSQSEATDALLMNEQLLNDLTVAAVRGKVPREVLIKGVAEAIESLEPRQQKVMRLYTFKEAPKENIARQLGITERTVTRHIRDGSRLVREKIAKLKEE